MIHFTCRKLWQHIANRLAPTSFGIVGDEGHHFFVIAHDFKIDRAGRLVLWQRHWLILRRVVSVVGAGKWARILRGVTWEDIGPEA